METFIEIIKEHLINEEISLNQFAQRIGIAERAVAKWMKSEYYPSIQSAVKVADYFNCSLDYLFGFSESTTFNKAKNGTGFYSNFVKLAKSRQVSFYQIAKACKFGQSMISKWKKGKYPKTETLMKLAEFFNCSVDYLVGRED